MGVYKEESLVLVFVINICGEFLFSFANFCFWNLQVEVLETQLKEAHAQLDEFKEEKGVMEKNLKEAVDKVWSLREIIQDLEKQVALGGQREVDLGRKIEELEEIISHQTHVNQEMVTEVRY